MKGGQIGATKPRTQAFGPATRTQGSVGRRRSRPPAEGFDFEPGEHLGPDLTVVRQISAGPKTEIYQVWSNRDFGTYACKVLRSGLSSDGVESRALAREEAILRRLSHPNIVRVYDRSPGLVLPHLLIEYLPGATLFERLSAAPRRRLPVAEALKVAIQIGGALEHLHSRSYLYRDLKPANVLTRDGVAVLIDFGSVYRYRPGRAPRVRIGTDPYMAPEQCLSLPLSPASDVFGLGAVLFEMLSGEWPYEEQLMNTFDRTRLENRFPQIRHAPGPLRRRDPAITPELEAAVRRCLARDPADRFASARDVVEELTAILGDLDLLVRSAPAA